MEPETVSSSRLTCSNSSPLLLAVTTLALVACFSWLPLSGYSVCGIPLKQVDLFADLRAKQPPAAVTVRADESPQTTDAAQRQAAQTAEAPAQARPAQEPGKTAQAFHGAYLTDYGEPGKPALAPFYEAVAAVGEKGSRVRIAYYGDSIIEGDLVSADLRDLLQKRFGGTGPGLQRIAPVDGPFRVSVRHTYSPNWKSSSLVSRKTAPDKPVGIAGGAWLSSPGSWVSYTSHKGEPGFSEAYLYYQGGESESSAEVLLSDSVTSSVNLASGSGLKLSAIPLPKEGVRRLKLTIPSSNTVLYGVSLEGGPGVYLDNFPLRGHSGLELSRIAPETLAAFERYLPYRLVILQFGVNVAQPGNTRFGWYRDSMAKVIRSLQKGLPHAAILLVSVADRSVKGESGFATDESIPALVEAQRRVAQQCGIAFFDLYQAMGGQNSMAAWAERGLAAADHIHISRGGGRRFAKLIDEGLMKGYDDYQQRR